MRRNPLLMTVMGNPQPNPCNGMSYQSNPYILIDSETMKVIRSWKGSMFSHTPWQWAADAARRLGRNVYVVSHPYVPPGFRPGVEVSKMFLMMGPYAWIDPEGRTHDSKYESNPGILPMVAGGIAGSLVTHAMSNPGRRSAASAEKALDKAIEQAWYRHAQGVQVSVLDIPKIFKDIKLELAEGHDLDSATFEIANRYRLSGEMPTRNPASRQARRFVSSEIRHLRRKGYPQKRAVAAALSVARKKGYQLNGPKKRTVSIEAFAKMVKAQKDPAIWADFVRKVKAYHKWSHGTWPKRVTLERIHKPGVQGLWITFNMGTEPEKTYIMPKGTKRKGAWKHPWSRRPELRGDAEAGFILTKMKGGNRLTDFLHG